jgi:hypothetical protein
MLQRLYCVDPPYNNRFLKFDQEMWRLLSQCYCEWLPKSKYRLAIPIQRSYFKGHILKLSIFGELQMTKQCLQASFHSHASHKQPFLGISVLFIGCPNQLVECTFLLKDLTIGISVSTLRTQNGALIIMLILRRLLCRLYEPEMLVAKYGQTRPYTRPYEDHQVLRQRPVREDHHRGC